MDTETAYDPARPKWEVQPFVLASVTDGVDSAIIGPDQLANFIWRHRGYEFVFHNVAFDYWVIYRQLQFGTDYESSSALAVWIETYKEGRFHDTMLLDQLIRLAQNDFTGIYARDLGMLSRSYGYNEVNKDDPHRTEYALLVNVDFLSVDRSWFDYPIIDVVALSVIYPQMIEEAKKRAFVLGINDELRSKLWKLYGPLTEKIQVGAAIALSAAEQNGFSLDKSVVAEIELKLREKILLEVDWFNQNHPQIWHRFKTKKRMNELMYGTSQLVPKMNHKELDIILTYIANEEEVKIPTTPKGEIKKSINTWLDIAPESPFVDHWSALQDVTKTYQFIEQMKDGHESYKDALHASYVTIVRTGRTSAREPNIQQQPREAWFRQIFVARSGYKLVVADYSAIELVTLASVLLRRYGRSKLAETIRAGNDPHKYTASIVRGIDPASWESFAAGNPGRAKSDRQAAKAINFGVPGGLGKNKLANYAKHTYGVEMTPDEAEVLKNKLIHVVYPELSTYLNDRSIDDLARNLTLDHDYVWSKLNTRKDEEAITWLPRVVRNIVSGNIYKASGEPYNRQFVSTIWDAIVGMVLQAPYLGSKWKQEVSLRQGSYELAERLFRSRAVTLTGRIRTGLRYTEERNTPFQGLAADGAKVALWRGNLIPELKLVAFIHDELVYEAPTDRAEELAGVVGKMMSESMSYVLQNDLPVKVAVEVSDRWEKP